MGALRGRSQGPVLSPTNRAVPGIARSENHVDCLKSWPDNPGGYQAASAVSRKLASLGSADWEDRS